MNLGATEILFIALVALVLFGPRRLPEIARNVGRTLRELRRSANELTEEFRSGFEEPVSPPRERPPGPGPEDEPHPGS